jgi:hypothetical protein
LTWLADHENAACFEGMPGRRLGVVVGHAPRQRFEKLFATGKREVSPLQRRGKFDDVNPDKLVHLSTFGFFGRDSG